MSCSHPILSADRPVFHGFFRPPPSLARVPISKFPALSASSLASFLRLHSDVVLDETPEFDVIEEQVDEKLFAAHFQLELLAEKRETRPKLEQKLPDMGDQTLLNLSLLGLPCRGEELEVVGVFQQLPREVGLAPGH